MELKYINSRELLFIKKVRWWNY